ncbi:GH25 family lysozyme [Paenibacillus physcomitrellae]|uniref:GH25 family lysozyme n=1 Tax=Paenibacillus physcomitrellae TaxID=1619311 RepID=UPI000B8CE4FF|nr:GH25 family lysozyme [Paenibacillus physcomitrellae]
MKKLLFFGLFAFLTLCWVQTQAVSAKESTHLFLNNQEISLSKSEQIIISNNRVLVPLRVLTEEMNYTVDWNNGDKTITIHNASQTIKLNLNRLEAVADGQTIQLSAAPVLSGNTAFVPIRFVGEQLGSVVAWESATKSVKITTSKGQPSKGTTAEPNPVSGSGTGQASSPALGSKPEDTSVSVSDKPAQAVLKDLSLADGKLVLTVQGSTEPGTALLSDPNRLQVDLPAAVFDAGFTQKYPLDDNHHGDILLPSDPNVNEIELSQFSGSDDSSSIQIVLVLNGAQSYQLQQSSGTITIQLQPAASDSAPQAGTSTGIAMGLDVSHHNGSIDWANVAASGYSFVFIKASEGKTFKDPQFAANLAGAKAAGLLTGAYHFLDATTPENARLEADHFIETLQSAGGIEQLDLPPVLDYEDNPGKLTTAQINQVAKAFLSEFETVTGVRPTIYTGNVFAANFDATFSAYKLWVAKYSSKQPTPVTAWDSWSIWQYSQTGSIPGVTGNVDLDQFNGTLDDLLSSLRM